jgi:hypothetical protein
MLVWNPSLGSDIAGYTVYYGSDGVNFGDLVGAQTNVSMNGLQLAVTNYFEVAAYDVNYNETPPSNQIEYATLDAAPMASVLANPANAGSVTGGGTFAAGSSVTVTATANSGYAFANWTENGIVQSISSNYNFTLAANRDLVANFTANLVTYIVATQSLPANAGSVAGGGTFAASSSVTVTATANSGYAFTNWTENGTVQSALPNYTFTLAANRNLIANFTATPVTYTVVASAGRNGNISPNGAQTVPRGSNIIFTATPASGYQINQWLVNGTVTQTAGSVYTLQNITASASVAVSFNAATIAPTNSVVGITFSTNDGTGFALLISGNGTLAPSRNGKTFQEGTKYTLTATASNGWVFAAWISNGIEVAASPKYTFMVESNVVLQANFVTNPFTAVAGTYHGLFYVASNATAESSGSIVSTVTSKGAFAAQLRLGGQSHAFSGEFSVTGEAGKIIQRPGLNTLTVQLQLDSSNGPMTGTVSDGVWTAELLADPAVYSRTNPAPQAGKYTLLIPGGANAFAQPGGNGFGTVIVDDLGNVTCSGILGEGTPFTSTSVISSPGQWPFYVSLYGGKGSLLGWLSFTNQGAINGQTAWFKLPQETARLYPDGFTNSSEVIGSAYHYTNGLSVLGFTNGQLLLTNGNLPESITRQIVLGANNQASDQGGDKLIFKTSSGQFNGRVMNPETGKAISVNGVVLQNQNVAAGFFLGTNQSGSVQLSPAQ